MNPTVLPPGGGTSHIPTAAFSLLLAGFLVRHHSTLAQMLVISPVKK